MYRRNSSPFYGATFHVDGENITLQSEQSMVVVQQPAMPSDVLFAYFGVVEAGSALSSTIEFQVDVPHSLLKMGPRLQELHRRKAAVSTSPDYHCGARKGSILGSTVSLDFRRVLACFRLLTWEEGYSSDDVEWPLLPTSLEHESYLLSLMRDLVEADIMANARYQPPELKLGDLEEQLRFNSWVSTLTKIWRSRMNWGVSLLADIDQMHKIIQEVVNAK
ncbi:MAG: uncharacterized protein KVP18_001285 [Porospora cf. gigantea A]|uniref:uncharacterized protein n=1 Tax=Porospora cf. gigantea A TaxID=2853593 RepID=UPI00355AB412|nr:MAG: hypothetical protein KVP18_001285 [Porospora cf. gigantea A]